LAIYTQNTLSSGCAKSGKGNKNKIKICQAFTYHFCYKINIFLRALEIVGVRGKQFEYYWFMYSAQLTFSPGGDPSEEYAGLLKGII